MTSPADFRRCTQCGGLFAAGGSAGECPRCMAERVEQTARIEQIVEEQGLTDAAAIAEAAGLSVEAVARAARASRDLGRVITPAPVCERCGDRPAMPAKAWCTACAYELWLRFEAVTRRLERRVAAMPKEADGSAMGVRDSMAEKRARTASSRIRTAPKRRN